MQKTKSKYVVVKKSGIHSRGIFAKKDIKKGTKIIEYVGEKITKAESEKRADQTLKKSKNNKDNGAVYIFELNKRYDIDGDTTYNTAKLINHSCNPNCESDIIKGHIWVYALRDIKEGEELTYDYNYDLEDYEDHPCMCGSKNCLGYIVGEEHRPKLMKILKKKN
jgi:SET domain-containing protein